MCSTLKCFVGLHSYEKEDVKDMISAKGSVIGLVIISRCANCGKLSVKHVRTVDDRL